MTRMRRLLSNTSTLPDVSNAKQRIASIQVCRGLAAMAVVLSHLLNVEEKYFHTNLTGIFQFGVLGVDLFFVISGTVISSITVGKFTAPNSAETFLRRRFYRILPIYWVYSALFLAAYLYNPLWFNNSTGHHVNILKSFLLIPAQEGMLVRQGWTLSYEMYFYLVFFLLLLLASENLAPVLLSIWGVAIIAVSLLLPAPRSPILTVFTSPMIFEFLAGCLIFHVYRRAVLHPRVGIILVSCAIFWLGFIVYWTNYAHAASQLWIEVSRWGRPALYGSFSALFLLGIMELERTKIIRFARLFENIGDWSYSIYLSHLVVVEIIGRAISHYAARVSFSIFCVDAIALPLVVLVGYLSYSSIEFPLMTLLSRRAGKPGIAMRSGDSVGSNP